MSRKCPAIYATRAQHTLVAYSCTSDMAMWWQVHGKATSIPGKALAGVIALLEPDLPAKQFQQLDEFHSMVVERLRLQDSQGQEDPKIAELALAVKTIAGLGSDQRQNAGGVQGAGAS